jgi:hypothetical protein
MEREVVSAESRIEQVVVYASGARIRRVATVTAARVVRFVGLPLAVIDDTVRTELEGPATIVAVRVGDDVPPSDTAAREETPELRSARRRVALAETEVERLDAALRHVASAPIVADDPSEDPPAPWAAVVAARRTLVAARAERELALRERLGSARREQIEARRALEAAAESDRTAGSARAAKLHEPRKYVELELQVRGAGELVLRVDYQVAAARWAPSYVARIDGEQLRFELRAVVAQDSGEDWQGVALKLSTAEPERFSELPELNAQRIGRRQQEPAKRGFKAPPTGADELYRDYDRGFPKRVENEFTRQRFDDSTYEGRPPAPPPPPLLQPTTIERDYGGLAPQDQVWDEESSNAMPEVPMAMPAAAMHARSKSGGAGAIVGAIGGVLGAPLALAEAAAQSLSRRSDRAKTAPGGEPAKRRLEASTVPATPSARLDYDGLVMAPMASSERGRLIETPRTGGGASQRVLDGITAIEHLALPPGHDADWDHVYDYAFASDGAVDVKSDATWHGIALTSRSGTAKLRHVAVPREQSDVFRVATIANPLDGPLLPGPIDVYDRGQFLVTSEIEYTPPAGKVEIGLGVDAQVKIARNAEFHEEATGVLRGGLRLVHAVTIEVENLAARTIDLELRERVPVTRDDDDEVEVTLGKVEPAWERWAPDIGPRDERLRGGYRWKLALQAGAKKLVKASYEIKIAGKHELVGGNRREP